MLWFLLFWLIVTTRDRGDRMFLILLGALAFGAEDIHEVKPETTVEVTGPAVWMTPGRYRAYVADSRKLPACEEKLDKAIDEGIAANDRALEAREVAEAEFDRDELLVGDLTQQVASLGAQLDQERLANARIRSQRNVAWGIAGGFLSASVAATAIALSN
jgi:hypothetical protein